MKEILKQWGMSFRGKKRFLELDNDMCDIKVYSSKLYINGNLLNCKDSLELF